MSSRDGGELDSDLENLEVPIGVFRWADGYSGRDSQVQHPTLVVCPQILL
jgi:hypothetical protein